MYVPSWPRLSKPDWCRCEGNGGMLNAPKGVMVQWTYYNTAAERDAAVADRDAAKAVVDEWFAARDAGSEARWTDDGERRPESDPIMRAWSRRWMGARIALSALQARCPHEQRSPAWSGRCCERCGQREEGKRAMTAEGFYIVEVA